MNPRANTGELTRTETVSPLTENYATASPFHPDARYIYYGLKISTRSHRHHECRQTCSDNQVHPQKVPCSHTNPPLESLQSDSWWDRLFQASWNWDSHTHMKQPCSFVNRGTLSSRQSVCSMCVCVYIYVCVYVQEQLLLGLWETRLYRTLTPNHSCVSHPFFPITCMCFQDTCASLIDRAERVINRKGGRNQQRL